MRLEDLIKLGTNLTTKFDVDMQRRHVHGAAPAEMNLKRRESLCEADFTSRPSSELFSLAVELSKACISKLQEIDRKNNKL